MPRRPQGPRPGRRARRPVPRLHKRKCSQNTDPHPSQPSAMSRHRTHAVKKAAARKCQGQGTPAPTRRDARHARQPPDHRLPPLNNKRTPRARARGERPISQPRLCVRRGLKSLRAQCPADTRELDVLPTQQCRHKGGQAISNKRRFVACQQTQRHKCAQKNTQNT
jgi:hypothetical protein